jgi:hypothetical protein
MTSSAEKERNSVAIFKCDVVDSTHLPSDAMSLVHDAVEFATTGYDGVAVGYPHWEGDGATSFFVGNDAATRAVSAALDAVERVRLIQNYQVFLRAVVGVDEVPAGADLSKVSPPDFNLAGHMVGATVCPPNTVCITEDVYFFLLHADSDHARRFSCLGTTSRDGAPVFSSFPNRTPAKEGGLRTGTSDTTAATLALRAYYPRPPFSLLRFYALPQFNFVGSLDLMRVFTPLTVRRRRLFDGPILEKGRREFSTHPPEEFNKVFGRHRSLVVLGDPGSGKTTLLRYLAIAAAGGRHATRQRLGVEERLLPVYVTAADLLKEEPSHTVARQIKSDNTLLGRVIKERAEAGEILFLVDGLDEMAEAADRQRAACLIEELAHRFLKCRFVVASRVVGYPGVALPNGEEVTLEPLAPEQARDLARAFYTEFFRSQKYGDAEAQGVGKGDKLVEALQQRKDLALFTDNPLLLSLAALVHLQLGELPRHRVKLYDVAVETLISAWAKARALTGSIPAVDYATEGRAVLLPLALHLHEKYPGNLIPERDLLRQIALKLPGQASSFLGRLASAGSLLVERGPGLWGFAHQTFQEYLVAKHIAAEDKHEDLLKDHLYDPRWKEIIKFTAGELSVVQGRGPTATKFIKTILADRRDWRATDLKMNVLLAAQCFADTACADTELEKELLSALEDLLSRAGAANNTTMQNLRPLRGMALANSLAKIIYEKRHPAWIAILGALGRGDLAVSDFLKTLREDKDGGGARMGRPRAGDSGCP